jgi:hypothetical protein
MPEFQRSTWSSQRELITTRQDAAALPNTSNLVHFAANLWPDGFSPANYFPRWVSVHRRNDNYHDIDEVDSRLFLT